MQLTQDLEEPKGRKGVQDTDQNALPKEVERTLGASILPTWVGTDIVSALEMLGPQARLTRSGDGRTTREVTPRTNHYRVETK